MVALQCLVDFGVKMVSPMSMSFHLKTNTKNPHKEKKQKHNTPKNLASLLQLLNLTAGVTAVFTVGSSYGILSIAWNRKVQLFLGPSQCYNLC